MDVFGGVRLAWSVSLAEFSTGRPGNDRDKQDSESTVACRTRGQVIQSHVQQRLLPRREWREWKRSAVARPQFHGRIPDACDLRRRSRHADARVQNPAFTGADWPTGGLCDVAAERQRGANLINQ